MTKINIPNTGGILTDVNLKKAYKKKVCNIYFQERKNTQSTYVNIFLQPQVTNDLSEFIKAICLATSSCSFLVFINFSIDGVYVESKDVCRTICEFFNGKASYLYLVDPNHIYKAVKYQIVGGSYLPTIGDWVLEFIILK